MILFNSDRKVIHNKRLSVQNDSTSEVSDECNFRASVGGRDLKRTVLVVMFFAIVLR